MAYRVHETLNKRVYIGDEVSKVFNALFDAREARVVSPWIKGQYAEKLMRLVREGRAYVITSEDPSENDFYNLAMSELGRIVEESKSAIVITKEPSGSNWALALTLSLFSAFIGIALMAAGGGVESLRGLGIFLLIMGIIGIGISLSRRGGGKAIDWTRFVRVSPPQGEPGFIHVKLYIIDYDAFIGSANLTPSAVNRNIEVLVKIPHDLATDIFQKLWERAKPIRKPEISQYIAQPKQSTNEVGANSIKRN